MRRTETRRDKPFATFEMSVIGELNLDLILFGLPPE
jgi:hypothetical protein